MTFPSGFLIIDKPTGATSFSMVSLVRRLTGIRRVGHAGTLDPLATGVLPVAIGQATRFIEYMDDAPKTYVARIRFGTTTDTYDAEGTTTATADASGLTRSMLEPLLAQFVGDIDQTPPAFSAIKLAGRPMYSYARAGVSVELSPRRVRIDHVRLLNFDAGAAPEAEVEVECVKGTYIRSLAHDLGQRLALGAHLTGLRRTASGGFGLKLAHTAEELTGLAEAGRLDDAALSLDRAVERRRAAILGLEHSTDARSGRDLQLQLRRESTPPESGEICRAYDTDGTFIGVLRHRAGGTWHPAKIVPKG